MKAALFVLLASCVIGLAAPQYSIAQSPPQTIDVRQMIGSVGPYRVGAQMTVRDHESILAAHYFYASKGVNIPLESARKGKRVILREPDGGVFDLTFETNETTTERPLNFYNSIALAGTWSDGQRTLPVRLGFTVIGGPQGADRYVTITDASAEAFEMLVRRFLHGVITGNRAQAASAVSYPLTVNSEPKLVVRNEADLIEHWETIFTPDYVRTLEKAVPHEMFVRNGAAMVSDGAVWFDARGAAYLNVPN